MHVPGLLLLAESNSQAGAAEVLGAVGGDHVLDLSVCGVSLSWGLPMPPGWMPLTWCLSLSLSPPPQVAQCPTEALSLGAELGKGEGAVLEEMADGLSNFQLLPPLTGVRSPSNEGGGGEGIFAPRISAKGQAG